MSPRQRGALISTLTVPRLTKYLKIMAGDEHQALRLYVINAQLSAAILIDLHYTEVALRNKFESTIGMKFGANWFNDAAFRKIIGVDAKTLKILDRAIKDARKHLLPGQHLLPGKVVTELTFGFWHNLTVRKWEHTLWTPCLSRSFAPNKPPARAIFNKELEELRLLRNRIAHHEPVFHLDLKTKMALNYAILKMLCPATAHILHSTSTVDRQLKALKNFLRRRKK